MDDSTMEIEGIKNALQIFQLNAKLGREERREKHGKNIKEAWSKNNEHQLWFEDLDSPECHSVSLVNNAGNKHLSVDITEIDEVTNMDAMLVISFGLKKLIEENFKGIYNGVIAMI